MGASVTDRARSKCVLMSVVGHGGQASEIWKERERELGGKLKRTEKAGLRRLTGGSAALQTGSLEGAVQLEVLVLGD